MLPGIVRCLLGDAGSVDRWRSAEALARGDELRLSVEQNMSEPPRLGLLWARPLSANKTDIKLGLVIIIYTIICVKSVCLATFPDCRSQFLLDRLGRCLKLIVSSGSTSCHEFASQFGLAFFLYAKNIHKLSRMPSLAHMAVE